MTIAKNKIVSLRYIMRNHEGEILEDTLEGEPVSYLQGGEIILPQLQQQLEGGKAGDRIHVQLQCGMGVARENFSFEVIIDAVRPALAEEELLGYPVQGTVEKCEADCNCYVETSQSLKQ